MSSLVLFLSTFAIVLPAAIFLFPYLSSSSNETTTASSIAASIDYGFSVEQFPILGTYVKSGKLDTTISKNTEILSVSLSSPACISANDSRVLFNLDKFPWIFRKYLTGYDESIGVEHVWKLTSVMDLELLIHLKQLELKGDSRVESLKQIRLPYHNKSKYLRGGLPVLKYYFNYTDLAVRMTWEALKALDLYDAVKLNITISDVERLLPIILSRTLTVRGMRHFCFPLLIFEHDTYAETVLFVGSNDNLIFTTEKQIRAQSKLKFDFSSLDIHAATLSRSVVLHGGKCNQFDNIDLHFEFPNSKEMRNKRCHKIATVDLEGHPKKLDDLFYCLITASSEEHENLEKQINDEATRYDLLSFLQDWVNVLQSQNYTAKNSNKLDSDLACVVKHSQSAYKKAAGFFAGEKERMEMGRLGNVDLERRRYEASVKGKSPLAKALYDKMGGVWGE